MNLTLVELAQAITDGEAIEIYGPGGWGKVETKVDAFPLWGMDSSCVRIKPKLKPVDLSVLFDFGIDCEFSSDGVEWLVGFLADIDSVCNYPYARAPKGRWFYCRPRMSYWASSCNGNYPCGEVVSVLRGAGFATSRCGDSFIVEGLIEGFTWPWECK